ncbi:pyridoxamine 5'-phosphate oxidase family protein [Amycolatopsis sp. NPDC051758]|uniref:pyridoxamine 5'-phosphate oxidase family protein n=1 Tax=Amycolatopsis sp. NPDC051758 TaxID=3363935 RepID=UPI0037BBBDBB
MTNDDLAAHARALISANAYLTLGTTGDDGAPWTCPVYFAPQDDHTFVWVSETGARHSRNIAARPRVSLVVFDSTVAPYHGRAVYAVGEAGELSGEALDRALASYPRGDGDGASELTLEDVSGASPYRMYSVVASERWVLCPRDPGQPCDLHGEARDHRVQL